MYYGIVDYFDNISFLVISLVCWLILYVDEGGCWNCCVFGYGLIYYDDLVWMLE